MGGWRLESAGSTEFIPCTCFIHDDDDTFGVGEDGSEGETLKADCQSTKGKDG